MREFNYKKPHDWLPHAKSAGLDMKVFDNIKQHNGSLSA
jgi:hypothetical protein